MIEEAKSREKERNRERERKRDRRRERGIDINSKIKRGKDVQELR